MTPDVSLSELLADLGFRSYEARERALAALVDANLTTGRKARIAASKLDTIKALLDARFLVVCVRAACRTRITLDARERVDAAQSADCRICGGAANEPAIDEAVAALHAKRLRRVVIVGGSPAVHEDLLALVGTRLELRLVSGTDRHTKTAAKADLAWADVIVIWGSTQLDHKISGLYSRAGATNVVTCSKRGIAALAETLVQFAMRR